MAESDPFFAKSKRGRGIVKHAILKYYLGGYYAIIGQSHNRLIYIDVCAGPGQYTTEDGKVEEGSPEIAYKTAIKHQHYGNFSQIDLIFIEIDEEKANKLKNNLDIFKNEYQITDPDKNLNKGWFHYKKLNTNSATIFLFFLKFKVVCVVKNGPFQEVVEEIVAENLLVPMLVFIDPYGLKGKLILLTFFEKKTMN